MKKNFLKMAFLCLITLTTVSLPAFADANGQKEGCTSKCGNNLNKCKDYCKDGTPVTGLVCFLVCEVEGLVCMLLCPIAG